MDEAALLLSREVEKALKMTFTDLCTNGEHYYYCTLTISGDGGAPAFSAWSEEAIERVSSESRQFLKWSYADSPYCLYKYDEYWKTVEEMWWKRPQVDCFDDKQFSEEVDTRIEILVLAMKNLDKTGLYELNQKREDIFINVEFAPPDKTNTDRAYLLNPSIALTDWLIEVVE